MKALMFLLCVVFVFAGCSKKVAKIELPGATIEEAAPAPEITPEPDLDANRIQAGIVNEGTLVSFTNIQFAFDSYVLTDGAIKELGEISDYLMQNRSAKLQLDGHACQIGTEEYNLALSEARAKACERYLVDAGVKASKISWMAYGEEHPLIQENPNLDKDQELLDLSPNRRVEVDVK